MKKAKSEDEDKTDTALEELKTAMQKQLDNTKKANEAVVEGLRATALDAGLTSALQAAGVQDAALLQGATAMLKSTAVVAYGDDPTGASITLDSKSIQQYITDWAATDVAKPYLAANLNSGGAARGSNTPGGAGGGNGGDGKTMSHQDYVALDEGAKAEFLDNGGTISE